MTPGYVGVYLDPRYESLFGPIYDCVLDQSLDNNANITTLKDEIKEICQEEGWSNPDIVIDNPYGKDMFIVKVIGRGNSMRPTFNFEAGLVINKTHDIHVGDIVSADSEEYGPIVKRVAKIEGDNVYLVSDNKTVTTYVEDGVTYVGQGVKTWVDISDIGGVVIDVLYNDDTIRV